MSKPVVEVQVRAVIPTSGGCAVFIGNEQKVFVIYVDQSVGAAITMFMRGTQKERPLTHDLVANTVESLGGELQDVYINDLREHTYFAKLRVRQEGELIEIDCRPSDAIAHHLSSFAAPNTAAPNASGSPEGAPRIAASAIIAANRPG